VLSNRDIPNNPTFSVNTLTLELSIHLFDATFSPTQLFHSTADLELYLSPRGIQSSGSLSRACDGGRVARRRRGRGERRALVQCDKSAANRDHNDHVLLLHEGGSFTADAPCGGSVLLP
jgi:hypothetical protein